jgi:hypothetical protein
MTKLDPPPGPQNPGKYTSQGAPAPGKLYQKYGEQPGLVYDPWHDKYVPDPNAQKKLLQSQGLAPPDPKEQTLTSTLLPLGAAAGTITLAQNLGKDGTILGYKLGELGTANAANTGTVASTAGSSGLLAPEVSGLGATETGALLPGGGGAVAPELAPGMFDLGNIGAAGNMILPAVGAIGAYDVLSHKVGPGRGLLEGAASGAAIGSGFAGVGAIPGAAIGGLIGLGKGLMEKPSTKEIQSSRFKAAGVADPYGKAGHDYFAGTGGEQSRDEKFLTPDAIRVNPDNYNNVPDWDSWTPEMQTNFLTQMLQAGKVQEKKGGIYYDDAYAKQIADQIRGQNSPGQAPPIARSPNAIVAPGAIVPPMQKNLTPQQAQAVQVLPPRSRTSSPGVPLPGMALLNIGRR